MEFELLGTVSLDLSHERFAYAGKFVMTNTEKVVAREATGTDLVAVAAFSQDYSDPDSVRIRYVTVREDRRGEGIGPQLLAWTAEQLCDRFESVMIAVNNPIAYQACHRAGFVWTGEETGIAELRMRYAPDQTDSEAYQAGLAVFRSRELPPEQKQVLERNATQP